MNYYFILYIASIVSSVGIGYVVMRKYRNTSGFFFFLFTLFTSLWFLFFFLFFSGIEDKNTLLLLSRGDFGISIPALYSFLFFIKYFGEEKGQFRYKEIFAILCTYVLILIWYVCTDDVVGGLVFSQAENVYRETYGQFYIIHLITSLAFVTLFIIFSFRQIEQQTELNRIRLKNILLSAFLLLASLLLFQLILPIFNIWIMEKEIILLFVIFALSVAFTMKRYYFSAIGYGVGKILIVIASLVSFVGMMSIIKEISFLVGVVDSSYWSTQDDHAIISTVLGVIFFLGIYRILHRIFLGRTAQLELQNELHKTEEGLSSTTNIAELQERLKKDMFRIFKTGFCELRIFPITDEKSEMQRYFDSDITDKIFINDIVFIEEKMNTFDKQKFLEELPEKAFLILPLFDSESNNALGFFSIGVKSFGDFYTIEEIDILREFVSFLELHLKYLKTYELLQDFTLNLDKKVDEKTIEYNTLINKQKEFISVISHEIKSPIANAIFQADSIMDDMRDESYPKESLKNEIDILSKELIKIGELTTKLFSVQYFDTRSITLFKEKVQIARMLNMELEVYSRMHENIHFVNEIDEKLGFVEIDKIQFQQVITNLLQNAVKFLDKKESVIILEAYKKKGVFYVSVEDNGRGFQGIEIDKLFDRYATGNGEAIGLGMGLYLCKRIIDMHSGTITASIGTKLSGAKISIEIPLKRQ